MEHQFYSQQNFRADAMVTWVYRNKSIFIRHVVAVQAEVDKISREYDHKDENDRIYRQEVRDKMVPIKSIFKETSRSQPESLVARNVLEDCVFDLKISGRARKFFLKEWITRKSVSMGQISCKFR